MTELGAEILISSVKMSIEMNDRDWFSIVFIPGCGKEAPRQGVVTSDCDKLLGGVPQYLGVDVDLTHSSDQVKWCWCTISTIIAAASGVASFVTNPIFDFV